MSTKSSEMAVTGATTVRNASGAIRIVRSSLTIKLSNMVLASRKPLNLT